MGSYVVDVADVADVVNVMDEFSMLGGARRDDALMSVEREIRRLQAVRSTMIADVAFSASFVDDGHHSPTHWLQAVANCARSTAARQVNIAAMLRELPVVALAASRGDIGDDQFRLLLTLFLNQRGRQALAESESEAMLVGYASTLTLRDFAQVCERWLAHVDPDGNIRDHELSRQARRVTNAQVGAGHVLTAQGDALSGDIINRILDAQAQAELDQDRADLVAAYGDSADQHPLARTARQRRYDALVSVVLKGAAAASSSPSSSPAGFAEPLVNIVTNVDTLNAVVQSCYGPSDPPMAHPPATSDRMWLCQTVSGAPVAPADLLVAVLVGQIRRVLVDSVGRVIDLGRRSRLFTGGAREAVLLGGGRCCWPGCDRVGDQIDHVAPWARAGGFTVPKNGAPMCGTHNRYKHRAQTTVVREVDGWRHHRSDGSEIAPRSTERVGERSSGRAACT